MKSQYQAFRLADTFEPVGYDSHLRAVKTEHPKFWLGLPTRKYGKQLPIDTIYCINNSELNYVIGLFFSPNWKMIASGNNEIMKQDNVLLAPDSYYWEIYGKHYVTMSWGQNGYFGYHLAEAISDIESLTGLELIKEKHIRNRFPAYFRKEFDIKIESGEIKSFYTNGNHSCYNIEDIKKCIPRCVICGQHIGIEHESWLWCHNQPIWCNFNNSACSNKCEAILTKINKRKEQKWMKEQKKQQRNHKQFQECQKLMARTRRALRKGDLNACKLLSEEFKQVATSH